MINYDEVNVTTSSKTPLLDAIKSPADLRRLPETDLAQVAAQLLDRLDYVHRDADGRA